MAKPRILCVSALPPPYHGTSVANDILLNNKLIKSIFDIRIVQLSKPELQLGGRFSLRTLKADLVITFKILKELITFNPKLTYVGIAQTKMGLWRDGIWIWIATLWGSRVLSHMHGGNFRNLFDYELDGLTRSFVKKTLARLTGIIVLDYSLFYLFQGLVAEVRIFVLRNGISSSWSEAQFAEANRHRANQKQLRVTYLSNLVPGKGFDTFLEAAALLKEQGVGQGFLFNLAGAAPTPEIGTQVEEFVKSRNLKNEVCIWERIIGEEKNRLLLNSDVFVFPTQISEGQPFVIIEALAAGLPVIATARGSITAMVKDGINGFIVPEGDPAAIADRLQLLRNDAPLRLSMGAASRKLFQENYTADKFTKEFAAILEKVIEVN